MLYNAYNGSVPVRDSAMDYVRFGRGSKNLIVLPGLSDGLATVRGKALFLAPPFRSFFKDFTVYMFSRRNDLPAGITIEQMADEQAEALEQLGIEKCDVLGVSQGGMIALALAVNHPQLIRKLVLAVSAPYAGETAVKRITDWLEMAERNDHKALMINTAENTYSREKLYRMRKIVPLLGHVGKPESYDRFKANADAILQFDMRARLHEIACPVLIIAGEEGRIVGLQASRDMHKEIPDSRIHIYKGLGHGAYEEAKDFYQRVFGFLVEGENA